MTTTLKITRIPYEEPHILNLVMEATNGRLRGQLEFYCHVNDLFQLADELEAFPRHQEDEYLWVLGSEKSEDRFTHYFRFRLFTTDLAGHCAIHVRFNNNKKLPDREISEFCMTAEPSELFQFGKLIREYSELKHEVLLWKPSGGQLFQYRRDAEQIV